MKFNNINKIFILGAISLSLFSCMDDDQDYPTTEKPTAIISPTDVTATEGDTITFSITMDKPAALDSKFKLEFVQGEAGENLDFSVDAEEYGEFDSGVAGYQITVPALETTASFEVVLNQDIFNDTEDAQLRFRPLLKMISNVENGDQLINITISDSPNVSIHGNDLTSGDLGVQLAWQGVKSFPNLVTDEDTGEVTQELNEDVDLCELDYDLIIVTPNGTQDQQAATGDCPETAGILASGSDGVYEVYADYYDNGGYVDVSAPVIIPVELTLSKIGGESETFTYDERFDISDATSASGEGSLVLLATITKNGNSYTFTKADINE